MDLSIIIPSYNTRDLLDRCLESIYRSLKNSAISFDIIVIDNGSTDGSVELVGKKHPRVDVVRNKENIGYGKANNQAIVRAKGSYVLLLNSDILVKDDAVSHLYRFAKEKGNVFAGGRLFNEDGSAQASCGPFYRIPVVFFMLFARGDMWGATRYSPSSVRVVDWVSGACLIGTRKSFLDVGLFDEHMFMYMEEIEFLYRAKQKGYPVFFYPDARFIHRGAASSYGRRTPVINIYRGLLYFYSKHYGRSASAVLRVMLAVKALAVILVGRMIGKRDLSRIYEEAFSLV